MKKYTEAERQDAIRLANEVGFQRAKNMLGIPATTLYRWKEKVKNEAQDDLEVQEPRRTQNVSRGEESSFIASSASEAINSEIKGRDDELRAAENGMNIPEMPNMALIDVLMLQIEQLKQDKVRLIKENEKFRQILGVLFER